MRGSLEHAGQYLAVAVARVFLAHDLQEKGLRLRNAGKHVRTSPILGPKPSGNARDN